jgi:hypothetical protein
MASRIPLVLVSGQIQQLQSGDTLAIQTITAGDILSQTNDEAGAIVIGAPVYNDANDGVKKAKADASGTKDVIGLVRDTSITNGVAGNIQLNGTLTATTGQWDAVFGTTGGLTKGTRYYLSAATSGLGTATAPSATGQYVVELGIAVSTTELILSSPFRAVLL